MCCIITASLHRAVPSISLLVFRFLLSFHLRFVFPPVLFLYSVLFVVLSQFVLCLMHTNCTECLCVKQQKPRIENPTTVLHFRVRRVLFDRNFHCDFGDSIVLRHCHDKYQKTSESLCMAMSNFSDRFWLSQNIVYHLLVVVVLLSKPTTIATVVLERQLFWQRCLVALMCVSSSFFCLNAAEVVIRVFYCFPSSLRSYEADIFIRMHRVFFHSVLFYLFLLQFFFSFRWNFTFDVNVCLSDRCVVQDIKVY